MQSEKYTNKLIEETSPYLLQHAHNPVDWMPWNDDTLKLAKQQNKMLLISVGYSACHWCHVMEHESFEDQEVAALMNKYFINIKVDREERPDIDQVYMSAVQLMTGQGGWPLNCFALPDGRPVYGGTYFPKERWKNVLQNLADLFANDYSKVETYAIELTRGMLKAEKLFTSSAESGFTKDTLTKSIERWRQLFDKEEGGMARAPKFPLPNNWLFLLNYGFLTKDEDLSKHVHFTLQKMGFGGIYDQLGGGFARYSVDAEWKVPHFEKMLYDNAQLISLYSKAYQHTPSDLYKNIIEETIAFCERELMHEEGFFFSALDADSEGEEGKFYVWKEDELKSVLDQKQYEIFSSFYNINATGYWEHGNYILLRKETEAAFCLKHQINTEEFRQIISDCKSLLMKERNKRVRPGLDDKSLCSWNGLMLTAYCDAYRALENVSYKSAAVNLAEKLLQIYANGNALWHSYKNGTAKINGFLEDYAFLIEGLLAAYEISGEEKWLTSADGLTSYCIEHFSDPVSEYFYFTSDEDTALLVRKVEISDNVIPASNSQMARNLLKLHRLLYRPEYKMKAEKMCTGQQEEIAQYGSAYSNWAILQCELLFSFREIAITGDEAEEQYQQLMKYFLPDALLVYSRENSELPLFKARRQDNRTLIYMCENNACQLPVTTKEEALAMIR